MRSMTPSTLTSATQALNPGLADRVPGRSATHTCEPCLGQGGGSIDFTELNKALKRRAPMHGCVAPDPSPQQRVSP